MAFKKIGNINKLVLHIFIHYNVNSSDVPKKLISPYQFVHHNTIDILLLDIKKYLFSLILYDIFITNGVPSLIFSFLQLNF